jgi:hypothetical protein
MHGYPTPRLLHNVGGAKFHAGRGRFGESGRGGGGRWKERLEHRPPPSLQVLDVLQRRRALRAKFHSDMITLEGCLAEAQELALDGSQRVQAAVAARTEDLSKEVKREARNQSMMDRLHIELVRLCVCGCYSWWCLWFATVASSCIWAGKGTAARRAAR